MTPKDSAIEILSELEKTPTMKEQKRRELFLVHISNLFPKYREQITQFALGAEEAVKISGKKSKTTGRIDTLKGTLLIEYKTDLKNTRQRQTAEDELQKYVSGLINRKQSVSKCLATDIVYWREYEVTIPSLTRKLTPKDVILNLKAKYHFDSKNPTKFIQTIERLIYQDVALLASGKLLTKEFGLNSKTYQTFMGILKKLWVNEKSKSENKLCLDLWAEYVENCFSKSAKINNDNFLEHTYLVILSRMIAATALSTTQEQTRSEFVKEVISGKFFSNHRVENFVIDDFFKWVMTDEILASLNQELETLQNDLQKIDFRSAVKFDLLSELYEEIIPHNIKAEYGGVFTPTWLADKIVHEIPNCKKLSKIVLDPACGTGTFLRSIINEKLKLIPKGWTSQKILDKILGTICGLDINPVSVIITKTTIMLALANHLINSNNPVSMPVHLCDTLFLPKNLVINKSNTTEVNFDNTTISFPSKLFENNVNEFDLLVNESNILAEYILNGTLTFNQCENNIKTRISKISNSINMSNLESKLLEKSMIDLTSEIFVRMKSKRDGIWAFVLKNTYRPSLLKAQFDIILSNPPWLAISSFPQARYKNQLETLARSYNLLPSGSSKHHLEISTIFAVHSVKQFLKKNGDFAIILPKVIFQGDHHNNFRLSKFSSSSPMKVSNSWNLENVQPLFNRPTCVIFGSQNEKTPGIPNTIQSEDFVGNPDENLTSKTSSLTLSKIGKKSAFVSNVVTNNIQSHYLPLFKQGADLMPRTAVMIDIVGNKLAKTPSIKTSNLEITNTNNKKPYNKFNFSGTIESKYIFSTLKSELLIPFVVGDFMLTALPVETEKKNFKILKEPELAANNDHNAVKWFREIDKKLANNKKKLSDWLTRRNKLIDQINTGSKYTVLFGGGGKNVCGAVVNTTVLPRFINDQTLYQFNCDDEGEAMYVCGMLNSSPINDVIKNHQPSGDFGEQHVHKLPLNFIPKFNPNDSDHQKLIVEAKKLTKIMSAKCKSDNYFLNMDTPLHIRRKKALQLLEKDSNMLNKLAKKIMT